MLCNHDVLYAHMHTSVQYVFPLLCLSALTTERLSLPHETMPTMDCKLMYEAKYGYF